MPEENSQYGPTEKEDAIKSIQAAHDSLVAVVSVCEEARQFLGVIRLATKKKNPELALTLLDVMIDRLDPMLQDFYKDMPDEDLVDTVSERMASPKIWDDNSIEHIEITDDDMDKINKSNDEK